MELGKRKEMILAAIVEQYVKTGEPVGSKFLMTALPISVSSATIRNEMSELAELGYLDQPHTSAGRIPSQKGYRYYIDKLMSRSELTDDERAAVAAELEECAGNPEKLLAKAGELLARFTGCTAIATTPTDEGAVVRRVEIVPVGTRIAMIVLMTSSGIIKNGICRTETPLTAQMIENFHQITDNTFIGRPVSDIGTVMIQTLVASLGANALSMSPLFVALADLAAQAMQAQIHLEGAQNLLHHRELSECAFDMMQFLDEDEKLSRAVAAGKGLPLSISIGSENMFRQLENSSMIVSRYQIRGHDGGAIGIIGPTRLDYARLIPRIEYLSEVVSKLLTDTFEEQEIPYG